MIPEETSNQDADSLDSGMLDDLQTDDFAKSESPKINASLEEEQSFEALTSQIAQRSQQLSRSMQESQLEASLPLDTNIEHNYFTEPSVK